MAYKEQNKGAEYDITVGLNNPKITVDVDDPFNNEYLLFFIFFKCSSVILEILKSVRRADFVYEISEI